MIIAIILAGQTGPLIQGKLPYLLPVGNETVIERVARVVLRGPFGATVVATPANSAKDFRSALNGFVVQYATLPNAAPDTVGSLIAALKFSEEFRARWEKAMAAASQRFSDADDDSDDDEDDEDEDSAPPAASQPAKQPRKPESKNSKQENAGRGRTAPADWSRHSANADVKVRGLARSFERDGVILFRGDSPLIRPELQAQLVEAFAREAQSKGANARPFAQAVQQGMRGFPVLIDRASIPEIMALPPGAVFEDWLLQQLARVQDVQVQESGALERIRSEDDYSTLLKTL